MNSLVYLAGPIAGCTYTECTDWREHVKHELPLHINTISPLRAKNYLEQVVKKGKMSKFPYDKHPLSTEKGINTRDHWDVSRCDVVFVNFLGAKQISIGTVMEIAWARAYNKPVICCMEPDNIHNHAMLNYSCGYIVDSLDKGIELLTSVLSTDRQLDLMGNISMDSLSLS